MSLRLSSPAFADGERIPERYGHGVENVNPPLRIEGVPEDAETLALVVDDPDAFDPAGKVWDHWTAWNVPASVEEIPEDWDVTTDGASEGTNDFGERGYGGPAPPDREHTYRFRLFALDADLDLPESAGREDVEDAVDGRVLDEALLEGTYEP